MTTRPDSRRDSKTGMFRARPRWTVSDSDWAVSGQPSPQTPHFYLPGPASPTPHFYRQGLVRPGPQTLTFIDRAWATLAPQPLTFIDGAWAGPAPKSLTFIDRAQAGLALNPPLLYARLLTSISQTPHFNWP